MCLPCNSQGFCTFLCDLNSSFMALPLLTSKAKYDKVKAHTKWVLDFSVWWLWSGGNSVELGFRGPGFKCLPWHLLVGPQYIHQEYDLDILFVLTDPFWLWCFSTLFIVNKEIRKEDNDVKHRLNNVSLCHF